MTMSWYVTLVTWSVTYWPVDASSEGGATTAVTSTSTDWPGLSMPPTARSSATVIDTARNGSESGVTDSSGPRIENAAPSVDELSMLVVTSWFWRIVTAGTRPITWLTSLTTPLAFESSSGTWRTATSVGLTAWRAGMTATATTAGTRGTAVLPAC